MHPPTKSSNWFHKGNRNKPLVYECAHFLFASATGQPQRAKRLVLQKSFLPNRHWVEVERRPKVSPLAEPQDSHPCGSAGQCFAILIQSTRKTREEQWLFLEVVVATSSLGTPRVLEIFLKIRFSQTKLSASVSPRWRPVERAHLISNMEQWMCSRITQTHPL